MTTLGHARLGLRLARREIRRHPWRSGLVLLMVVIPTLGMTVGATLLRTGEWSAVDRQAAEYGPADAVAYLESDVEGQVDPNGEARLRASLPAGSYLVVHDVQDRVRLEDRRSYLTVSDLDLDHPLAAGRYGPVDGRLPIEDDEAVLTTDLLEDLDLEIGDTITPERIGQNYIVVGAVDSMGYGEGSAFITGPVPGPSVTTRAYIDQPNPRRPPAAIRGWSVSPTGFIDCFDCDADRDEGVFWTYLGGAVALLVLGTVIAAAFAVGARRQLRTIGLLSATGGSPRTVRWFLLAQGVIGGALGALLGVGLGVALTRLIPEAWLESLTDRPVNGPVTRISDVLPILVIGTLAAVGAAWLPARSAARVPTLQALAGRRPQPKVPRRLPLFGALAVAGGCALLAVAVASADTSDTESILVAVAGSVAVLGGALAVGPWAIAGLERLSGRWPESGRLAGRSLARSRLRSSAVVGAICAVSATVIAGSTLYRTFETDNADDCCSRPYVSTDHVLLETGARQPVPQEALNDVLAIVDGGEAVAITDTRFEDSPRSTRTEAALVPDGVREPDDTYLGEGYELFGLGVGTAGMLDALDVPAALRGQLDDGAAISVVPVEDVGWVSVFDHVGRTQTPVPFGGSFDSPMASYGLPEILVGPDRAAQLGLEVVDPPRMLVDAGRPITGGERHELELLADDIAWNAESAEDAAFVSVYLPDPEPALTPGEIRALGYALVLLLIGAVVAVGLALAAKDTEDEARVLTAVGAPPRTVRRVGALRAGLLVATATAIALPAGLLPAWAIIRASREDAQLGSDTFVAGRALPIHLDWLSLGVLVVVVPVAVMAVALGWGWLRDHARRPRPLVFALTD